MVKISFKISMKISDNYFV